MTSTLLDGAPDWFLALLNLSLQSAILFALVIALTKTLGRWIPPAWRALLWFIVIARVLIPVAPPSPFSLQNLFVKPPAPVAVPAQHTFTIQTGIPSAPTDLVSETPFELPPAPPSREPILKGKVLAVIWSIGASLSFLLLAARYLIIRRHLAMKNCEAGAFVIENLARCRMNMRICYPIRVAISDRIAAPALTGLFPARLIVPSNFAAQNLTPEQIRHVLMHELAHLNQGHLLLHWLALIARALNWFNPIIHFAATRLRQECELAADEAALKNAETEERIAYGETILKVLSQTMAPSSQLALGIAEQARHMEQRLRALSVPPKKSFRILGAFTVSALLVSGLSGADNKPQSAARSPNTSEGTEKISESLESARVMIEEGRFKEAEAFLLKVVKADPKNRDAMNYLSTIQATNGTVSNSYQSLARNIVSTPLVTTNAVNENSPLYTRTYQIASRLFLPLMSTNAFSSNPVGRIPDAQMAVADLSARNRPANLPLRPYETGVSNAFRLQTITNSSGEISLATVIVQTNLSPIQKVVRAFFGAAGVDFATNLPGTSGPSPAQKALFYNDRAGVLYVRATLEDLDKVERALHTLNSADAQMMFEVRVFTMAPDVPLDLFTNLTVTRTILTTNEYLFAVPKRAPANEPQLRDAKEIVKNLKIPVASTINIAQSSEYIIPNHRAEQITESLLANSQVESLALPKLTTAIGRLSIVSAQDTMTLMTENVVVKDSAITDGTVRFEFGTMVWIEPQFASEKAMSYRATFNFPQFLGYAKDTETPLPRIRLRSTQSLTRIPHGQTQVIIVPPHKEKKPHEDDRRYVIFTTPTVIDSRGNPIFKESK